VRATVGVAAGLSDSTTLVAPEGRFVGEALGWFEYAVDGSAEVLLG
jgi:hypothetical protein